MGVNIAFHILPYASFVANYIFFLRMFTKYPIEKMFFTCAFKSFLTPATVFCI